MLRGALNANVVWVGILAGALVACTDDPDIIGPTFTDELVEAAGRTAAITVVTDQDCDVLMAVVHEEIGTVATVVVERRVGYPLNPADRVLEPVNRGQAIAIDLVVLDAEDHVVARGCVETTLQAGVPAQIAIEMVALPICDSVQTSVDLAVILDISADMAFADATLGNVVIDEVKDFVDLGGFPSNTRFSVFSHGPGDPVEVMGPTEDREMLKSAVESLRDTSAGTSRHYEAILLASERLRTRAVCQRRPAILVISAGTDTGPDGSYENAIIGLIGARGDPRDDIFALGLAVTIGARDDLKDLIEEDIGEVLTAGTGDSFRGALSAARYRVQGLVGP